MSIQKYPFDPKNHSCYSVDKKNGNATIMIEISVICSDDERKMTQRFLINQEGLCLSHDDPSLNRVVNEAIQNFKAQPLDVVIKLKYTW